MLLERYGYNTVREIRRRRGGGYGRQRKGSVNILDGFDSSKHSGVIAYFNRNYLKTENWIKGYQK